LVLLGCEQRWNGFFYPNGVEGKVEYSSTFKSKEDCLDWCHQKANSSNTSAADFECGKNCKLSEFGTGLYICEETVDG